MQWYRPKYCIIGVVNKVSRISLNLELVHRYNTNTVVLDCRFENFETFNATASGRAFWPPFVCQMARK